MKQYVRVAVLSACLLGLAVAAQAQAQSPEGGKPARIAVINVDRIRKESVAMKDIGAQIQAYRNQFRDEIQREEEALRSASQELARQRAILSSEVFADERRKFQKDVGETQREVQKRKLQIDRVTRDARLVVQNALNEVVLELAKENGLTLILRTNETVLFAPNLEITEAALKLLNARIKTVKVSEPGVVAK